MKFIKFVTYLFYRYYSKGATKDVAYIKTVGSAGFLILIHVFIFLIIFKKTDLIPDMRHDSKIVQYLKMALYTLPIFLFFLFFVREKGLKEMVYDEGKLRSASKALWAYVILSFILMIALMFAFARKL